MTIPTTEPCPTTKLPTPAERRAANQAFKALTPRQQRIQIATDVLKHLEAGTFIKAQHLGYFRLDRLGISLDRSTPAKLQHQLLKLNEPCTVCAMGALLLTKIRNYNGYSCSSIGRASSDHCLIGLEGIFSNKQLRLIENAYEHGIMNSTDIEEAVWKAARYMYRNHDYDTDTSTMQSIMQNILDHNGDFIVPGFTAQQCGVLD